MRVMLSITCLVLLGLLVWQHKQDELDRKRLMVFIESKILEDAFRPCYKTNVNPRRLKNHDDKGGWDSILPKPTSKLQ